MSDPKREPPLFIDEMEYALNKTLQRMARRLSKQFTAEDLANPRICALGCAMAMQLFLAMADVSEEERQELFQSIIPDMRDGWVISPSPLPDADGEDSAAVKFQANDDPEIGPIFPYPPTKLIH